MTRAHFVKYPNPHARHVTAGDVLERRVVYVGDHDADRGIRDHSQAPRATDSDDQRRSARNDEVSAEEASPSSAESSVPVHAVLESTRIFVKRGKVPRWGQAVCRWDV